MGDVDRKKRAEQKTVPKLKQPGPSASRPPTGTTSSVPERSAPRAKRVAGKRGGLIEEIGERVRRDPRREDD